MKTVIRGLAVFALAVILSGVALLLVSALVLAQLYSRRRQLLATTAVHARLADAETKLGGLLGSVPDAVWSSSADRTRLRYISPSVTGLFGLSGDLFALQSHIMRRALGMQSADVIQPARTGRYGSAGLSFGSMP